MLNAVTQKGTFSTYLVHKCNSLLSYLSLIHRGETCTCMQTRHAINPWVNNRDAIIVPHLFHLLLVNSIHTFAKN